MKPLDRILMASKELAAANPADKITFADIADKAEVHWTTVRRHFGSKELMRRKLKELQNENDQLHMDTRSKIVSSAAAVFAEYGYEGATLDLIAEQAGMTKGAVYWHFSSKGDLFLELVNQSLRNLLSGLPRQLEEIFQSNTPQESIKLLIESQFKACEEEKQGQPSLFFEFISKRREPEIKEKLDQAFKELFEGTAEILKKLQQRNLISAGLDPQDLSVTLHGLLNGAVLMWTISPKSVPLASIADSIAKTIWEGIKPQ